MAKQVPFTTTFLAVKIIDIGITTVYFFIIGVLLAKAFDTVFNYWDEEDYKNRPMWSLFLEIVFHLFCLGVVAYALRNFIERIPFPLDGVAGYNHLRLKELGGGQILPLIMIFFQKNIMYKLSYFVNRLFGLRAAEYDSKD